jgi:hypothetical protein
MKTPRRRNATLDADQQHCGDGAAMRSTMQTSTEREPVRRERRHGNRPRIAGDLPAARHAAELTGRDAERRVLDG